MENKVLIGIHMDFEVAVDATEENYDAIKAFVTYLDGNKDRLVEALQNLIDPYYEAVRASSINMQKGEHERVKQKVTDAEAAGLDPLATGAYASGLEEAEEMKEGDLRHIVREALKRKLLKEFDFGDSSMLDLHRHYNDRAEEEQRQDQAQRDYIDLEYGEGAYDQFQLEDELGLSDVSYESPLDDPLAHPAEIDSYWQEGSLQPDEVLRFAAQLAEIPGDRTSDVETGETIIGGMSLSEIDPALDRFDDWSFERTFISPLTDAAHGPAPGHGPRITSAFGPRTSPLSPGVGKKKFHRALDIGGAPAGTPFVAPATGIVVATGADAYPGEKKGAGNYLIIKTQDPTTGKWLFHKFFHLNKEPNFKKGEAITQGQQLGEVGNTGSSTGSHLHWQIHQDNIAGPKVDPADLMAKAGRMGWEKHAYKPEEHAKLQESQLRYAIQEALKRKLSPLKEAEEVSSAKLYQVVLVLSVTKPIRDIKGKLNRIRAIEGVTIVSHEREEEIISRGDVVAKVKFHPMNDMMTPATFINQYLIPQINDSKIVPEVKVLQVVQGTMKEI